MHPERYKIPPRLAALVERVREDEGRIWAVGTTVVRALESAARPDGTVASGRGRNQTHDYARLSLPSSGPADD